VMSPIRRRMKKRNPSGGQNGQLVHWWLLFHSGPTTQSSNGFFNQSDFVAFHEGVAECRVGVCSQGI